MITFDFETKSYGDLKKIGTWAYSLHPTTDVICCAYGIDYEPVQTWWPGKDVDCSDPISMKAGSLNYAAPGMPYDLQKALQQQHTIEAHNAAFERSIWANVMVPKYGWIMPGDEQWRDTMAVACYYAMPAALDKLARVLGFPGKNPEGSRLISKYSKLYLKTAKTEIPDDWNTVKTMFSWNKLYPITLEICQRENYQCFTLTKGSTYVDCILTRKGLPVPQRLWKHVVKPSSGSLRHSPDLTLPRLQRFWNGSMTKD